MHQETPTEDHEETLFLRTLGIKSPALRILDFLMDNKAYDYSKTDIAKGAGISRTTLSATWENLEKNGLVSETRAVGRAKMYKLNLKSPVVQKFIELDNAICELYASRLERQENMKGQQDNKARMQPLLA
jgi:DNA-binding MarR family transcriptional regulator